MIARLPLLTRETVALDISAANPRAVLHMAARAAARAHGLDGRMVLERLLAREREGSTALGRGVAVPHAGVPGLDQPVGVFLRLARPLLCEAPDGLPVDLVFTLLGPEGDTAGHLRTLAWVCRQLRDDGLSARLRGATSDDAVLALLHTGPTEHAA